MAVVTLSSLKWRLVYFLVNNMTLQFQVLYWRRQSSWKHILIHIRMDVDLELFTVQKVLEHFLQLLGRSYYNLDASVPSSYICIVLHPSLFGYSNCQWKDWFCVGFRIFCLRSCLHCIIHKAFVFVVISGCNNS